MMGRTTEKAIIRNLGDRLSGRVEVREVEVAAIVDTGATFLVLPLAQIKELGLAYSRSANVMTASGVTRRAIYVGAEIQIFDRVIMCSVMEGDDSAPPLIGYLILEEMDFVVDPKNQRIIPNPEHGGKWMNDLYLVA